MANFRTTADYVQRVLKLAGESPTNTSGPFYADALEHLNTVHRNIIQGGSEFGIDVDEVWPWAMTSDPMPIEILPAVEGSIVLTKGDEAATFTAAPTDEDSNNISLLDYYIRLKDNPGLSNTVYRLSSHSSGSTSAELNTNAVEASGTYTYVAYKLDYKLQPSYLTVRASYSGNIFFSEASGKTPVYNTTITAGAYTPAELATALTTGMTATGANTYTVSYDTITSKFRILSACDSTAYFYLIFEDAGVLESTKDASITNKLLGIGPRDITGAAVGATAFLDKYSDIPLGAISRLGTPLKLHTGYKDTDILALDITRFDREFPLSGVSEGNPDRFSIRRIEQEDIYTIRLNKYPKERMLMTVDHVPVPVDLYNNNASRPLIPANYSDVLLYGAASKLLLEKEDSKWEVYQQKAGAALEAMMRNNRKDMHRTNPRFGQTIAREDLTSITTRVKRNNYGYTAG